MPNYKSQLSQEWAKLLLTKHKVVRIDKHYNNPKLILDNGIEITFDTIDHGSGTYETIFKVL